MKVFCQDTLDYGSSLENLMGLVLIVLVFQTVGYISSFFQKIVIQNFRDNA
jgi:hypothetical protein